MVRDLSLIAIFVTLPAIIVLWLMHDSAPDEFRHYALLEPKNDKKMSPR